MTESLRARLLVELVALLSVGLLVADVATYWSLQKVQLDRVDQQLDAGKRMAASAPDILTRAKVSESKKTTAPRSA